MSLAKIAELTVLGTGRLQLVSYATHGCEVSPSPYVAGLQRWKSMKKLVK